MKFMRTLLAAALVAVLAACSNGAQDSAQDAQQSADTAQQAADQAQQAAAQASNTEANQAATQADTAADAAGQAADQAQQNHKVCRGGHAKGTQETQLGNRESGTATIEKKKAVRLWNAIADRYGLTKRQYSQL